MLPENTRILRGWARNPHMMMAGIDEGFDASMFIGYHSAASEDGNPLAHTMNSIEYDYIKLNGMILSEFIMNAYTSIYYGIPVAFLSGDEMLCENAKKIFPNIVAVAVSKGIVMVLYQFIQI